MNAAVGDERLVVMLEARISEFEKRMARAERTGSTSFRKLRGDSRTATRQMERDMGQATSRINQALATTSSRIGIFGKAFAGGLVGGVVAGAFAGISTNIQGVLADMSNMVKAADRVGVASGAFQGLQHGLGLAGVSASDTTAALEQFVDRLGDAQQGTGALFQTLSQSGVVLNDTKGQMRPVIDLLKEYADVVKNAPNAAARMALVTDAFGRGGKAMAGALAQGSAGIDQMISEAERGGYVIEDAILRRAEILDDKFANLTNRLANVFKVGTVEAATFFGFVERERQALEFNADDAARLLGQSMADALDAVPELGQDALATIESLKTEYRDLANEARAMVPALSEASTMMRGLGNEATAQILSDLAAEIGEAARAFDEGNISGAEYQETLRGVLERANDTIGGMEELDRVRLGSVIGQVESLLEWIELLPAAAAAAREEVARLSLMDTGTPLDPDGDLLPPSPYAPTKSPRPQAPGVDSVGDWEARRDAATKTRSAGRGGGGKTTTKLDSLIEELQLEREILEEWYAESLALLNGATDAQLEALGGRHEAMQRLEQEHAESLAAIDRAKNSQRLDEMGDFYGAMASLTAAGGDKLVKVTRVFGALEAYANTKRAQAQVLADPTLGFVGKMAAYGTIGAAGLSVVAAIKGGSGGGGGGGRSSSGNAPAPAPAASQPTRLTIDLVGEGSVSPKQLQEILSFIQTESKNGIVIDSTAQRRW